MQILGIVKELGILEQEKHLDLHYIVICYHSNSYRLSELTLLSALMPPPFN
jgi:hypothetical protein